MQVLVKRAFLKRLDELFQTRIRLDKLLALLGRLLAIDNGSRSRMWSEPRGDRR